MPKIFFEKLSEEISIFCRHPEPASSAIPEVWKNLDKFNYEKKSDFPKNLPHRDYATIRLCPAINDSMNFGYIVFNPVDIFIDASQEDYIEWYTPPSKLFVFENNEPMNLVSFHPPEDYPGFKIPEEFHKSILKINPLFGIKTEPGYSCWITHPINNNILPFRAVDGIVDTDVFPTRSPFAFFIRKNFKGIVKAGTPLIQVIPFKREEFTSEIVELDLINFSHQNTSIFSLFSNSYKKIYWKRKKFF